MAGVYVAQIPSAGTHPRSEVGKYLNVERPPLLRRKLVEILFYLSVTLSAFSAAIGLPLPFAIGGIVTLSGAFTFGVWILSKDRLPISIWFAIAITALANLSQLLRGELPVFGVGLRSFLFWVSFLLMLCYLLQNQATQRRVLLFLSALVIVVVVLSGVQDPGYGRLRLEGAAGSFGNANALAYTSGIFSVALLFLSLRSSKKLRLILWAAAAVLFYDLFLTVSRGGLFAYACGIAVLLISVLSDRGVRIGGIVMIVAVALGSFPGAYLLSDHITALGERVELTSESKRLNVYSLSTLHDLKDTALVGRGREMVDGVGSFPRPTEHNTFLYTHMTYGGIAAWVYLAWLITLGIRILRMMRAHHLPFSIKLEVVAMFGMGLVAQFLSNQGQQFVCTIYVTALVERYTAPYGRRQIGARLAKQREGERSNQEPLVGLPTGHDQAGFHGSGW